jgi:cytochrome bd-type quinol oxidase subunit 1
VQGLDAVPPGDRPPVNVVRVAFQTMVGIGTLLAALGVLTLLVRVRRRRLPTRRAYYSELIAGPGLPAVIVSGAAGVSALGLVFRRRFQLARFAAALAVAAIVAGWALAQQPELLPGLTVDQAAAPVDAERPADGLDQVPVPSPLSVEEPTRTTVRSSRCRGAPLRSGKGRRG